MTKNILKISSYFLITVFLTLGLSVSFQSLLAAWTAPLANPPICAAGNPGCDSPDSMFVNVTGDTMTGDLKINNAGSYSQLNHETNNPFYVNSYDTLQLRINSDGAGAGEFGINNSANGRILTVTNTGNVGVGTTDPGAYKLNVNGSIYSTSINTASISTVDAQTNKLVINRNSAYTSFQQTWFPAIYSTYENGAQYPFLEKSNLIIQAADQPSNPRDILFVTTDSSNYKKISLVITRNGNIGIGTGAPLAMLHVEGGGALFSGGGGDTPVSGPGKRLMWIPGKSAFRAGTVDSNQWDNTKIGDDSTALGNNTTASGNGSTALGNNTTASGAYSTAMGSYTTASKGSAIAMGAFSLASGDISTAMGSQTTASGNMSTAMGSQTIASGAYSIALGKNTTASGNYSTALGAATIASGNYSTAFGSSTKAMSEGSLALGRYNVGGGSANSWVATDPLFEIGIGTNATNLANALTVLKNGNVGIGKTNPGEKLEVNGAIKFGADASTISKAPRVIHTEDPIVGCPPTRPANVNLFAQTFTLARVASVYISASMIRNYSGRADLYLYVDGLIKDQTLDFTPSTQWFDDNTHWAGVLAAGNHTVSLRSNKANIWGCGGAWGSIDTILFE